MFGSSSLIIKCIEVKLLLNLLFCFGVKFLNVRLSTSWSISAKSRSSCDSWIRTELDSWTLMARCVVDCCLWDRSRSFSFELLPANSPLLECCFRNTWTELSRTLSTVPCGLPIFPSAVLTFLSLFMSLCRSSLFFTLIVSSWTDFFYLFITLCTWWCWTAP